MEPLSWLKERSRVSKPRVFESEAGISPWIRLEAKLRTRRRRGKTEGREPESPPFPSRSSTSRFSRAQISAGTSPEKAWKGRARTRSCGSDPRAGLSFPASLRPESGRLRREGKGLGHEAKEPPPSAEMLRDTTREPASHATPGHEQWSPPPPPADQRPRSPSGSEETEALNWSRADRSAARGSSAAAQPGEGPSRRRTTRRGEARVPARIARQRVIAGGARIRDATLTLNRKP